MINHFARRIEFWKSQEFWHTQYFIPFDSF